MLTEIVPGRIWFDQARVRIGPLRLTSRMTVVRLSNDRLWVHSPIPPTDRLRHALAALGTVAWVVAPNRTHHLHVRDFLDAYPRAQGFVAPGLDEKLATPGPLLSLADGCPWEPELQGFFIAGLPVLDETVFFHVDSGTLIVTDLLFAFGSENPRLMRWVAAVLGVHGRLAMSRSMKMMVKDRDRFRSSVQPLTALPVERVVVGHDSIIEESARDRLNAAFAWLG